MSGQYIYIYRYTLSLVSFDTINRYNPIHMKPLVDIYLRVVRKVLVLSYEGEDLLALALSESSAKGVAKVIFLFAKVLCKCAGLLTGSWSDEPCVFTGSAGRMPADQSWPGNAQPEGRRKNTPLQKQPPASRNRLVGVLKLLGQVECNFQPDFRECLA